MGTDASSLQRLVVQIDCEPGELSLSQWLCCDDSTVNIVLIIMSIVMIIIINSLYTLRVCII